VFIVNLAISDLITVIGTIPFGVDFMLRGQFTHGLIACGIMQTTFLLSLPSSVLNLSLLTAERLITIKLPFHYMQYLTKRNITIAVISIWSYTLLVALFPIIYDSDAIGVYYGNCVLIYPPAYDFFQLIANFLIPILFICFANIVLFYVANRQALKMQATIKLGSFVDVDSQEISKKESKEKVSKCVSNNNIISNLLPTKRTRKASISARVKFISKNVKAAKRIGLLLGVFFICWVIYIILVVTNISCGICHPRELTWIGNIINYSSTAINPLLYGMLNKNIRQEVLKKVRQFCRMCSRTKSAKGDSLVKKLCKRNTQTYENVYGGGQRYGSGAETLL